MLYYWNLDVDKKLAGIFSCLIDKENPADVRDFGFEPGVKYILNEITLNSTGDKMQLVMEQPLMGANEKRPVIFARIVEGVQGVVLAYSSDITHMDRPYRIQYDSTRPAGVIRIRNTGRSDTPWIKSDAQESKYMRVIDDMKSMVLEKLPDSRDVYKLSFTRPAPCDDNRNLTATFQADSDRKALEISAANAIERIQTEIHGLQAIADRLTEIQRTDLRDAISDRTDPVSEAIVAMREYCQYHSLIIANDSEMRITCDGFSILSAKYVTDATCEISILLQDKTCQGPVPPTDRNVTTVRYLMSGMTSNQFYETRVRKKTKSRTKKKSAKERTVRRNHEQTREKTCAYCNPGAHNFSPCEKCRQAMACGITLFGTGDAPVFENQDSVGTGPDGKKLYFTRDMLVVSPRLVQSFFTRSDAAEIIQKKSALVPAEIIKSIKASARKKTQFDALRLDKFLTVKSQDYAVMESKRQNENLLMRLGDMLRLKSYMSRGTIQGWFTTEFDENSSMEVLVPSERPEENPTSNTTSNTPAKPAAKTARYVIWDSEIDISDTAIWAYRMEYPDETTGMSDEEIIQEMTDSNESYRSDVRADLNNINLPENHVIVMLFENHYWNRVVHAVDVLPDENLGEILDTVMRKYPHADDFEFYCDSETHEMLCRVPTHDGTHVIKFYAAPDRDGLADQLKQACDRPDDAGKIFPDMLYTAVADYYGWPK